MDNLLADTQAYITDHKQLCGTGVQLAPDNILVTRDIRDNHWTQIAGEVAPASG